MWFEYQARRAGKMHSELSGSVAMEGMASARCAFEVGERRCGGKYRQAPTQQRPVFGAKAALREAIIGADPGQLIAPPDDLDGGGSLTR